MKVTLIFPYQFYVTIVRLKITFFKTSHHTGFKEIQPKQLTGFYMRHVFTENYFRKNYRIKLKYKPFLAKRIKSEVVTHETTNNLKQKVNGYEQF